MNDQFFKAIADQNRRKILNLLKERGVLSAGEISEYFEISKPSLSDHLKILKNADLIYAEKKGQFIYYRLNTSVFQDFVTWIIDLSKNKEGENEQA
jgi:DNA-binding transcriptional ArsR family regulator